MLKQILSAVSACSLLLLAGCGSAQFSSGSSSQSTSFGDSSTSSKAEVTIDQYGAYWQFRSVGLMNLTRDPLSSTSEAMISGSYTKNLTTAVDYAKEMGANYVEVAIMLDQKPTLEELFPYYEVVPKLARERDMNVYFRGTPRESQMDTLVHAEGDAFKAECQKYFDELEQLWTQMDGGLLEDGDVVSTWAEGDMQFTDRLGWDDGTKKYQQYVMLAADFIDHLREKTGLQLYYTESICGGEARLRDEFTPETAQRLDFISWDHYAGIMIDDESRENMKLAAEEMVGWIKQYSELFGTKIALGEWSTHWNEPKSKEEQAAYIQIMMDALDELHADEFAGMEYFHYALPGKALAYATETLYYASPVIDATGTFPGYENLQRAYLSHSKK